MSKAATFASRLGEGAGLVTGWIGIPDPLVAGHLAQEVFDCIVLDMQHGQLEFNATVLGIAQVAARDLPAIVRIPVGAYSLASRLLDVGASGIIAPMINSVEDARQLVAFTKYQPLGERSWGPSVALGINRLPAPEYLKTANKITVAIPMIETASALAAIDDILAVDGIDGAFVGPYDLSIALTGAINPTHPDVIKALETVLAACRKHGKAATVMGASGERARELIAQGYDMVAVGPDSIQLREGARAMINAARQGQAPASTTKSTYA